MHEPPSSRDFQRRVFTPTKIPSSGLSKWLQGHFVAQAFQPPDQGSADAVHVDPVKVFRTEFPVVFLTLQHVIGNLQQCMSYRHDRALGSPPSSNAPIQRREIQFVVLLSVPAILVRGLCERQSETASVADAATQTLRHLEPIFILRCGPLGTMPYS